jgi:hypothetical protein
MTEHGYAITDFEWRVGEAHISPDAPGLAMTLGFRSPGAPVLLFGFARDGASELAARITQVLTSG